ncbi:MAG: glucosamine-6-phosphate deaminase [Pirellula sp.]|nr:glucosamine-6-phosphate deaminase [Pirellula sp.]
MGAHAAKIAGEALRIALSERGGACIVVATGSSQFEVLDALVQEPGIDWGRIDGFHLDEYVGIPSTHPASFCGYLKQRFVDRIPIRSFHYLDGLSDPTIVCHRAEQAIRLQTVDVAMIGIGENGHLAFNDPPANFDIEAAYHVVELDEACRKQQVGEGWFATLDDVPKHAISMTIREILRARQIVCSVPDARKAPAVRAAIEGPLTNMLPASILRQHPNTTILLDESSAQLLTRPIE